MNTQSTPSSHMQSMHATESPDSVMVTQDDIVEIACRRARNDMLQLAAHAGNLCREILLWNTGSDPQDKQTLVGPLQGVLQSVVSISLTLDFALLPALRRKMRLNEQKYPVHLVRGKSGKYTDYSSTTGITKTHGQTTLSSQDSSVDATPEDSFEIVLRAIRQFAVDRDWQQYHQPRNLCLALQGEVGELCELLQFHGDVTTATISLSKYDKLQQEVADVTIYCLRLVDVLELQLAVLSALPWQA